jgi:hypothetical protein
MNDVWLLLKRQPATQKAFEQFLAEQQDPKSPNYHKWLTTKQMGDISNVPEPSSLFLMLGGAAALVGLRRLTHA